MQVIDIIFQSVTSLTIPFALRRLFAIYAPTLANSYCRCRHFSSPRWKRVNLLVQNVTMAASGVCLNVRASVLDRQSTSASPGPKYSLVDPAIVSGHGKAPTFKFGTSERAAYGKPSTFSVPCLCAPSLRRAWAGR